QINWEASEVLGDLPLDFFGDSKGAVLMTKGFEFRVKNPPKDDPTNPWDGNNQFNTINPQYPEEF
ncbi:unnamed protein product, partial [Ostreobium quekettii]